MFNILCSLKFVSDLNSQIFHWWGSEWPSVMWRNEYPIFSPRQFREMFFNCIKFSLIWTMVPTKFTPPALLTMTLIYFFLLSVHLLAMLWSPILGSFEAIKKNLNLNLVLDICSPFCIHFNYMNAKYGYLVLMYLCIWYFITNFMFAPLNCINFLKLSAWS